MTEPKKPEYYTGPQAADFTNAQEPFALFEQWFADATTHEPNDPNAMALSTVDASGMPNVRMVLLKGLDATGTAQRGFVFYTNFESAKGREILATRKAAHLLPLEESPPASPCSWRSQHCLGRRSRRLLCVTATRIATGRLGLAAVAATRKPVRAGEGGGGDDGQVSNRRNPAARPLVGPARSRRSRSSSGMIARSACMIASQFQRPDVAAAWLRERLYP